MKRISMLLLVLCLVLGLLSGCGTKEVEETPEPQAVEPSMEPEVVTLKYAQSYDEVFQALSAAREKMDSVQVFNGAEDVKQADTAETEGMGEGDGVYYSGTNVQVDGVDEGDIVKTDGTFIYILRDVELIIMKADGKNVTEVSHTIVGEAWESVESDDGTVSTSEKAPYEMYLAGDRAVILSTDYDWTYNEKGDSSGSNYISVDIYDLGDRSAPTLAKSLGQDGYQVASRMIGDKLYLCTSYYVDQPKQGEEDTFVPCFYADGKGTPVDCGTICLVSQEDSTTYAVVGGYDIAAGNLVESQSVLGGGETVYMNTENLYLCRTHYGDMASEKGNDGPYEVTTHLTDVSTTINRFAISEGSVTYAATGSVPGSLNNQFSLDVSNGYLRMATTEETGGYKVYVDEGHKFENYEFLDTSKSNDVFVLNDALEITGSVRDIAPDESVYSARFDGDYGYLCTYQTVDPIFAVDLSDPSAPQLVGELSLTGYSDYLHLWTEHQLFGLGMQTQEIESDGGKTARVDGMKMVMIDASNPADLKEESTLEIDADYSQALYNHKAILVDQTKNIIAFPAEGNYLVYEYSAEQGFQLKKEVSFEGEWDWQSRGLYIGEYFYVVGSDCIYTIDLNSLENVGKAILSRG